MDHTAQHIAGETVVKDVLGIEIAGSSTERYGFAHREHDTESGLVHMRARMYDPRTGRFTQTDPIRGNRPGEHYLYAGNNPITRNDPQGLYWGEAWEGTKRMVWSGVRVVAEPIAATLDVGIGLTAAVLQAAGKGENVTLENTPFLSMSANATRERILRDQNQDALRAVEQGGWSALTLGQKDRVEFHMDQNKRVLSGELDPEQATMNLLHYEQEQAGAILAAAPFSKLGSPREAVWTAEDASRLKSRVDAASGRDVAVPGESQPAVGRQPLNHPQRSVAGKRADFLANPENWSRVSVQAGQSKTYKGGISLENSYENTLTGEQLYVHELYDAALRDTRKHPSFRAYGKTDE